MGEGEFLLPTGTVTLLLADVEGSTRQWEADPEGMGAAIAELNEVVDEWVGRYDGVRPVEQGEGDSLRGRLRPGPGRGGLRPGHPAGAGRAAGWRCGWGCIPATCNAGTRATTWAGRSTGRPGSGTWPTAARRCCPRRPTTWWSTPCPEECQPGRSGRARLKDLSRPEHVYQLCHPTCPPSSRRCGRWTPTGTTCRCSAPRCRAARGDEPRSAQLVEDNPLVTLTGSEGCGKTRLAIQSGAELVDDSPRRGVVRRPGRGGRPGRGARPGGVGVRPEGGPGMTPTDALAAYLGQRRAVLILDNCEHVLDAAAALADTLLGRCPDLRMLATSRQPLGVQGEVTWRVPSLPVPDEPAGRHRRAVRLRGGPAVRRAGRPGPPRVHADRAQRRRGGRDLPAPGRHPAGHRAGRRPGPGVHPRPDRRRARPALPAAHRRAPHRPAPPADPGGVGRLEPPPAHRPGTDGVPPAGRVRRQLQPRRRPGGVRRRRGSSPTRCSTCSPCWSTSPWSKSTTTRRTRPATGCSRPSATTPPPGSIAAGEDADTRTRHRDHYLALAERAEPHLEGPGQTEWMHRVALDYPNLRAALAWSRDQMDAESLTRQAGALAVFWYFHGPHHEGEAWLDAGLNFEGLPPLLAGQGAQRARPCSPLGHFDAPTMLARSEEGLALARQIGDLALQGRTMAGLGLAAHAVRTAGPGARRGVGLGPPGRRPLGHGVRVD